MIGLKSSVKDKASEGVEGYELVDDDTDQPVKAGKVFASMTNEKNGLIGSVYFDWGRIRTVHSGGPTQESHDADWSWAQFNYKEAEGLLKHPKMGGKTTKEEFYAALAKFCGELIGKKAGAAVGAIEIKTPADAFANVGLGAGYSLLECGKNKKSGKFNGYMHPSRGFAVQYTLTAADATALKAGIAEANKYPGKTADKVKKRNDEFYKKVKDTGIGAHIRAKP